MNGSRASNRGRALPQALLLVVLGSVVAVAADLALPNGVLSEPDLTLRDLELLMPVRLWDAADAAAAAESEDVVLIDGRSRVEYQIAHAPGALNFPADEIDDVPISSLERLAGKTLIVIFSAKHYEDARYFAQDLAANVSAAATGTLKDGFEAWDEAGLPTEKGR